VGVGVAMEVHGAKIQKFTMGVEGNKFLVTGGSGLCGRRLVEMLVERGADKVLSFDIASPPADAMQSPHIDYVVGDITDQELLKKLCVGLDGVFHIAALVGPFHPSELYWKVNYEGTVNVVEACKFNKVPRIVMSSSPSTRMDGTDIVWKTEDELPIVYGKFSHLYAETKAKSEMYLREQCSESLMTIAVAPHQVYGPRDGLMLPNLLHACKTGRLRIFGNGENEISMCYVDNYCHGLILGFDALYPGSPALGKYYVITDGPPVKFWRMLDDAAVAHGYTSLFSKFKIPTFLLLGIAHLLALIGSLIGVQFKLTPFTVKMMTIHRTFNIAAAQRDLKYTPLFNFKDSWKITLDWFKENQSWWEAAAQRTAGASNKKKK
jgi:nucleoside-diphosphate-sugar epimerase